MVLDLGILPGDSTEVTVLLLTNSNCVCKYYDGCLLSCLKMLCDASHQYLASRIHHSSGGGQISLQYFYFIPQSVHIINLS